MNTNMSRDIVVRREGLVAWVVLDAPPHNHVTVPGIAALAAAFAELDADDSCRAVVLASAGKSFCAGADFASVRDEGGPPSLDTREFYRHAMKLFDFGKPVVAAVQGAAVGAGVGLALAADFRIATPAARFSVNFNRLGFHPGFGLTVTLPRLIGAQQAALLFYTGRRIGAEEALRIGLVDECLAADALAERCQALADEIATSAPLAVRSTRQALRAGLAEQVRQANAHEYAMQQVQFRSDDFQEGVRAMAERRPPVFRGR